MIDHVADLTGLRDRDRMDVTLASAFGDLLHPHCVAIYRPIGEPTDQRWTTRACLRRGDLVVSSDPAWAALDELPPLAKFPARCTALSGQEITTNDSRRSTSCYPLMTDREVVGVIEIVTDAPLDAAAQRIVASMLRIYRNFQSLLDYSERDTLTGLLNRKTFDETFFKVVQDVAIPAGSADGRRRVGAPRNIWLAMVDIDFFKSVNDNFGHLIGDEVLLLLSRLMRSSLRCHDRLYRFGGEEFVVVSPCATEADAAACFERLRKNAEAFVFPQVGRLTISIGFTMIEPTDSPSGALERADRAVYHAKEHGRNQVRSHAELVANGQTPATEFIGEIELF